MRVISGSAATNSRIVNSTIGRDAKNIRIWVRERAAHPLIRQFAA
jgi:hypothetical protein